MCPSSHSLTRTELLIGKGRERSATESQLCAKCFKTDHDVFHLLATYSVCRAMLGVLSRKRNTCH